MDTHMVVPALVVMVVLMVMVIALLTTTTTAWYTSGFQLRSPAMGFIPLKKRGNAKLTEAQVRIIKQDLKDYHEGKSGDSPLEIAKILGLGAETIRRIDRGETWGWVTLDNEANLAAALAVPPTPEEEAKVNQIAKEMFEWEQARKTSAVDKMAQSVKEVKRPDELVDDIGKS